MSSVDVLARVRARRAAEESMRLRAEAERDRLTAEAKGDRGPPGPKGDPPDHEWQGTKLRFEKPDGGWGELVDLRGPKGARGQKGGGGGGSGSASSFDVSSLPLLLDIAETDTLVLEREGAAYRVSIAMLREVIGGTWSPPAIMDGGPAGAVQASAVDGGTTSDLQDHTITGGGA